MIALIAALLAAPSGLGVQPPPRVEACAVAIAPRDYVGRKFTIRTKLAIGRHVALLNYPSDCGAISFRALPDSQAWKALDHIQDVMIGVDYGRRLKTRAPKTLINLDGVVVTATGTMVCPYADRRCEMHLTGLENIVYPASFPREMVPPDAGWAGP